MQKFSSVCLFFYLCTFSDCFTQRREDAIQAFQQLRIFVWPLFEHINTVSTCQTGVLMWVQVIISLHHSRTQLPQADVLHGHQLMVHPSAVLGEPTARGEGWAAPDWHPPGSSHKDKAFLSAQARLLLTTEHGLNVAGVNLTAESCVGCSLWWVSRWAVAICARDASSVLVVIEKHRQDSPWESIFVYVLCPPVGPSLLVTHEFSTYATAASLTNVQPLSLWNLIYSCS